MALKHQIVIVAACAILASVYATNYCTICTNNIGCNNNGQLQSTCPSGASMIPIPASLQKIILDKHNDRRNQVANGSLPGFKSAQRMAYSQWDPELATLAQYNANKCQFAHDACHNTDNFTWSGQNIGNSWYSNGYQDVTTTFLSIIDQWFVEYKYASMDEILAYEQSTNGHEIGHFTEMVNEKNTYLGCGGVKYLTNNQYTIYFVCNYAFNNIYNYTVYTPGAPCSACKTGCHPVYKALCSVNEPIVPVP